MTDDQQRSGKQQLDPKMIGRLAAAQAVIGLITLRDINKRGKDGVRGPRLVWKLWGTTNTVGSLMYWKFGRRKPQLPAETEA